MRPPRFLRVGRQQTVRAGARLRFRRVEGGDDEEEAEDEEV